jgi:hypothetical protein
MKRVLVLAVFFVAVSLIGYGVSKITLPSREVFDQGQVFSGNKFTLQIGVPIGFQQVEGTDLGMKNSVVAGNQVFTTLSFISNQPGLSHITVESLENKQGLSLDKFIMVSLPNRDLYLSDDVAYFQELKKGMQHIQGDEVEVWVQSLTQNIDGYEAFAYAMNSQKKDTVILVNWQISPQTDSVTLSQVEVQQQYSQLKETLQKMKIQ